MSHPTTRAAVASPARRLAAQLQDQLVCFLWPILTQLNTQLDVRLVRTFLATVTAIVMCRHATRGLLVSELGAYLDDPAHAPAGTKRLSRLLASPRWQASLIQQQLWRQAATVVQRQLASGLRPLLAWDGSVLEKPESQANPDWCAVRSSKARRLGRPRRRFWNPPPTRAITVPGLHWLGLLVATARQPPVVAAMRWWTTRGARTSSLAAELAPLLTQAAQAWGHQVVHLFDREFAGAPWIGTFLSARITFVVRWKKGQVLLDAWGEERKAWQIPRGKRSVATRWLRDPRQGDHHPVGIWFTTVTLPTNPQPLWLIVARSRRHHEPWYLLTNQPVANAEAAWHVVFAYARRWQIEWAWRFGKSELAMQSPRVWDWERREKLLLMATLVYAFLLSLLVAAVADRCQEVLRLGCHRTGTRGRRATAPLYRLRLALSRLWMAYLTLPLVRSLDPG